MNITQFLFSVVPIIALIWLMAKKNGMPSYKALPIIAIVILLIQLFYWGNSKTYIAASVVASAISTFVPVTIIFGAILFNRFIETSGAISIIKSWLANITPNPVAQLMIIGWAFAFMIEGASGFGTPAAIAAPLLVSLGFRAVPVCILTLVMNSVPVSFGAVGTPTWYGFSQLTNVSDSFFLAISKKSVIIHAVASLIVPVIALRFVVSWNEIRRNIVFIYASIIVCVVPYYFIAQVNTEFPALVGGAIGLLLSVAIAKTGFGIANSFDQDNCSLASSAKEVYEKYPIGKVLKALFPFFVLIGILIVTRVKQLPFKELLTDPTELWKFNLGFSDFKITKSLTLVFSNIFNTTVHDEYKLLYVPALIPFVITVLFCAGIYRLNLQKLGHIFATSLSAVKLTYVALFGAFVMVKLMLLASPDQETSMVTVIGGVFAVAFGAYWVYFASLLGAIGTFFSGSATVSNLTFGSIQQSIAQQLGTNQTTILALQSVGGAMGNMVCLNNIIAVCSVTGVLNSEGYIIKRTAIPMFTYAIVAGAVAYVAMLIDPTFWA